MKHQIRVTPVAAGVFTRNKTVGAGKALRLWGGWVNAVALVLVMAVSCMVATAAIDRGNIQGTVADEQKCRDSGREGCGQES